MLQTELITNLNNPFIDEIANILKKWINIDKIEEIKNGIKHKTYPYTITLFLDNTLIGFYQIVLHDNDNTDYLPWIANVFIKEEYRKQGYGKKLIKTIPKYMSKLNIDNIFLHTRHKNLYEKFGWQLMQILDLNDNIIHYMYTLKK